MAHRVIAFSVSPATVAPCRDSPHRLSGNQLSHAGLPFTRPRHSQSDSLPQDDRLNTILAENLSIRGSG